MDKIIVVRTYIHSHTLYTLYCHMHPQTHTLHIQLWSQTHSYTHIYTQLGSADIYTHPRMLTITNLNTCGTEKEKGILGSKLKTFLTPSTTATKSHCSTSRRSPFNQINMEHCPQYFLITAHMYVLVLTQPSICLFHPNGTIVSNWWPPALRIKSRSLRIQISLPDSCAYDETQLPLCMTFQVTCAIIRHHEFLRVLWWQMGMWQADFYEASDNEKVTGCVDFFMITVGMILDFPAPSPLYVYLQCRSSLTYLPPIPFSCKLIFSHG